MSAENEESLRWRLARFVVWGGIFAGMALFWSLAGALIASAIR